jgi:hypothetical protein
VSHWSDAGFGTDPEGDAARRAELEPARVDRETVEQMAKRTGWPVELLLAPVVFTSEPEPVVEVRPCCNYREDLDRPCRGWQRFRAGDLQAACDECGGWCGVDAPCRARDDEPLDDLVVTIEVRIPEELDPHAITRTEYPWGVAWRCACGRWEAVATGPSSAAYAERDHTRHVRDEEAGTRGG